MCGRCGASLTSAPVRRKGIRYLRYACPIDRGGCGRCGIAGEPLDALVTEAVLRALDTPALAEEVAQEPEEPPSASRIGELEARLAELAERWADEALDSMSWQVAREGVGRRLADARAALAQESVRPRRAAYTGQGGVLRETWPNLSLEQRRAVVASVIERITIAPTTRANNRFDALRVSVSWRV